MWNVTELEKTFTPEIAHEAREYLLAGNILRMREDSFCEYNALLRVCGKEVWAELTLNAKGDVEDIHCPYSDEDVIPAIAMLYAAGLIIALRTTDLKVVIDRMVV